mmetsp:Transcript_1441/g.2576  ORF Transcript_1441/g.2576 Transcript_1441/m.2576 type:complete len:83 (+) Transcript_1441:706-954(+)
MKKQAQQQQQRSGTMMDTTRKTSGLGGLRIGPLESLVRLVSSSSTLRKWTPTVEFASDLLFAYDPGSVAVICDFGIDASMPL